MPGIPRPRKPARRLPRLRFPTVRLNWLRRRPRRAAAPRPDRPARAATQPTPFVPTESMSWIAGATEPTSATVAATARPLRPWPHSILGRLAFARRVIRGTRSRSEDEHVLRLTAIAAARDVGENAPLFRTGGGPVVVDPPHRGLGRARFLAAVEERTPALSRAVTGTGAASERVLVGERRAARAREDLAAARGRMPSHPTSGDFGTLAWLAMILAFAAIEGIATRALWADVTDDKRLGLIFSIVFAIVFTVCVHVLATWLWSLASDRRVLRGITLSIVVAMIVCAAGLLLVAGFERDKILIANRVQDRALLDARRSGSLAAQSVIQQGVATQGPSAGGSAGGAATTGGGGLLGALGGSAGAGTSAGSASTGTATGSAAGAGSAAAGGLTAALPGATATSPATTGRSSLSGAGQIEEPDDVSFRFVIWLNMLVFLAMLLFTRGRTLGNGYRRAAKRLRRLEKRDARARQELSKAETRRQDVAGKVDYAARVLVPLAARHTADEIRLDRLFVDQVGRAALAAGHGPITVELATQPEELYPVLERILGNILPEITAASIRLGSVPFVHDDLLDGIAGGSDEVSEPTPDSPFRPTQVVDDPDPPRTSPDRERRTFRTWRGWRRRAAGHGDGDGPGASPPASDGSGAPATPAAPPAAPRPDPIVRPRDRDPVRRNGASVPPRVTPVRDRPATPDPSRPSGPIDGEAFDIGELLVDVAAPPPARPRDRERL